MPHNRENHNVRQPGDTQLVSIVPAGKVQRLPWPHNQLFFLLVRCLPSLGRAILVIRIPRLPLPPSAFLPSPRHHAACLICI